MKLNKIAGILLAVFVSLIPVSASAETVASTTASAQIQAMLIQIQNLQTQIQAMKNLQSQIQTTYGNIQSSLGLIRSLKQGMTGDDVKTLQTILAADSTIYPEGIVSGFFGRLTSEAVKRFQRKHGIDVLGIVGPKTLKKLNEEKDNLGISEEDEDNASSTDRENGEHGKRLCIPPGHMIAPGWLKNNSEASSTLIALCKTLPPGIVKIMDRDDEHHGTTTVTDIVAPLISNLLTANTTASTTSVSWNTNELATSKVWFGTTTPLNISSSTQVVGSSGVLIHTVPISGLASSTIYYYVVVSSDSSGNTATSSQNSFTTLSI